MSKIGNFTCIDCTCGASRGDRNFQFHTTKKEEDGFVCPNNDKLRLKLMGYKSTTFVIDKAKHAKGRSSKEKYERSVGDFRKNILPTLAPDEQKHFNKKHALQKAGKMKKY